MTDEETFIKLISELDRLSYQEYDEEQSKYALYIAL